MSQKMVKWLAVDGTEFGSKYEADVYDHNKEARGKVVAIVGEATADVVIAKFEEIKAVLTPPKRHKGRPAGSVNKPKVVVEGEKAPAAEEKTEATKSGKTLKGSARADAIKQIAENLKSKESVTA